LELEEHFDKFPKEKLVLGVMEKFVKPGDHVVDGGANVGIYSAPLARLVGPGGEVMAFEPDPRNVMELVRNLRARKITNVAVIPIALSFKVEITEMSLGTNSGWSSIALHLPDGVGKIGVLTAPIDELLKEWGPIRLIKLDCEGAEPLILLGSSDTLRRGVDAVICEINFTLLKHAKRTPREIRDFMALRGYDTFLLEHGPLPIYCPPEVELIAGEPNPGDQVMINVLFSTVDKVIAAYGASRDDVCRPIPGLRYLRT
jgi:FkbM family methyltransferase